MKEKIITVFIGFLTIFALCFPAMALDPLVPVEIDISLGTVKLSATEVSYYVWNTDSGQARQIQITGNFNPGGYVVKGTQAIDKQLIIDNPPFPVTVGTVVPNEPPKTYQVSGTLKAAEKITIYGNLNVLGDMVVNAGKTTVTQKLSVLGDGTLPGNLTVDSFGSLAGIDIVVKNNAYIGGTPAPGESYAVSAKNLTVQNGSARIASAASLENISAGTDMIFSGGKSTVANEAKAGRALNTEGVVSVRAGYLVANQMRLGGTPAENWVISSNGITTTDTLAVSAPVQSSFVSAGGNVGIESSGKLSLIAIPNTVRSASGNLSCGGMLDVYGTITAADIVKSNGSMRLNGLVKAGSLQSVNGDITAGNTVETTRAGIAAKGHVAIEKGAKIAGAISAQFASLRGDVSAASISVTNNLENYGNLNISGGVQSNTLTLEGTVRVRELTIQNGDLYLRGKLTASGAVRVPNGAVISDSTNHVGASLEAGSLEVKKDIVLNYPASVKGAVNSTEGSITVGAAGRLENASSISAKSLNVAGALNLPGTSFHIREGGLEAGGALSVGSGKVSGTLRAPSINIKGDFTANGIYAHSGALKADGRLQVSSGIEARDGISFGGPVKVTGAIFSKNGTIYATKNAPIEQASSISAENGSVKLDAKATVSGEIYGRTGVELFGRTDTGSIRSGRDLSLSGETHSNSVTASATLSIYGNTDVNGAISAANTRVYNEALVQAQRVSGSVSGKTLSVQTRWDSGRTIAASAQATSPRGETKSMIVNTDSNGRIHLYGLSAKAYRITVDKDGEDYSGNITLPASGTASLNLRSNSSSSNNSNNSNNSAGSGGQDTFDEDEFWEDVSDRITSARKGDIVRVSAGEVDSVPVWILKELKGRPITLKLSHGRYTVEIEGDNMYSVPSNRVYYLFEDLAKLYETPPDQEKENVSSSSKNENSSSVWEFPSTSLPSVSSSTAPPSGNWNPTTVPGGVTSSSQASSSSSSLSSSSSSSSSRPESSSSEEDREVMADDTPEPEEKKKGIPFGVIVGIVALVLAVGGGAAAYLLHTRQKDDYIE